MICGAGESEGPRVAVAGAVAVTWSPGVTHAPRAHSVQRVCSRAGNLSLFSALFFTRFPTSPCRCASVKRVVALVCCHHSGGARQYGAERCGAMLWCPARRLSHMHMAPSLAPCAPDIPTRTLAAGPHTMLHVRAAPHAPPPPPAGASTQRLLPWGGRRGRKQQPHGRGPAVEGVGGFKRVGVAAPGPVWPPAANAGP